jgi:hypothetical protein
MINHAYSEEYQNFAFTREDDGVLVPRFHTDRGTHRVHRAETSGLPGGA